METGFPAGPLYGLDFYSKGKPLENFKKRKLTRLHVLEV